MTSDIQTYIHTYILPLVVLSAALQQKITVKKIGIENPRKFFSKSDKISSGKMLRTTTFDTLG